jgi:hypothetical protein
MVTTGDIAHLLTHSITTKRSSETVSDVSKWGADTFSANLSATACLIQPLRAVERMAFEKDTPEAILKIYVAGTPDIKARDRIVIVTGPGELAADDELDVITELEDQGGGSIVSRFYVRRFQED